MAITPDNWEDFILETPMEDMAVDTDTGTDVDIPVDEPSGNPDTPDVGISEEVLPESNVVVDGTSDGSGESEQSEGEPDREEVTETESTEPETIVEEAPTPLLPSGPIPVYLVDDPEEASIDLYAVSGSAYPGTISTAYLDYFEGIADKLGPREHYVIYRSGQYEYKMFWGENLEGGSGHFSGSDLSYCSIYTGTGSYNMTVSWGTDTLSLSVGTGYVYSDLGDYPSITKGGTSVETLAILFALGFFVVYSVCHDIFDYIMEHVYRK